jgi:hypothetical protein
MDIVTDKDRAARRRLWRQSRPDAGWNITRRPVRRGRKETAEERRERWAEQRTERRREYRAERDEAAARQRQVTELYAALFGPVFHRGQRWKPQGLLDQLYAAGERDWHRRWTLHLRLEQRRTLGLKRGQYQKYAVTLARPVWIRKNLKKEILEVIRKQVQRQAKRLKLPFVVTGIIDVCPLRDVLSGTEGWAFHVHLTIQLAVSSYQAGKEAIREAFPYKSSSRKGVPRARVIEPAYDARGWDGYQTTEFVWGKVKTRTAGVRRSGTGRLVRRKAVKRTMSRALARELAVFFSEIRADNLMIWVRHHRYQGRLQPT